MNSKTKSIQTLKPERRFPEFQHMEGWRQTELKKIAKPVSEKASKSGQETLLTLSGENGLVHQGEYFGKRIAGDNTERYTKIIHNDFVYNDRTTKASIYGTIKRLSKYPNGLVSPIYKCFRFQKDECPSFWEFYFESGVHESQLHSLINEGARAGRFNISVDKFLSAIAWRPNPDEQQKISDCLSSLDELITAEDAKLEALQQHKKGLMQELFPAEGKTLPKLRFSEFQNVPEWDEKELGELGNLVSGLTYSPDDVREMGLLVLRSSNIQEGAICLEEKVYVSPDVKGVNLSQPNDILICVRNGSKSLIGKNALIPEGMPICTHGAFMTVFRSESWKFVFQLFQTNAYQKQVDGDLGATINSINGRQFMKYKFVVPLPDEQKRIADFLSSIDDLIIAQTKKLDALHDHKKGLMQQLFPTIGGEDAVL
jgi:type I restriction enzyme S subunit